MKRFEGKVAVVTGGSSGIGYSIVKGLVEEGGKVVVGARGEDALKKVKDEFGDAVEIVVADVVSEEDNEKLVQTAVEKFGKLNLAFNVAGGSKIGKIESISEEDWMWTVNLCLKGVFLGMKHQITQMKKNGGGAIVNVSSLNSDVPMWGGSAYAAAKAGVSMLTKNAVLENSVDNIRFNALLPGLIETPLTTQLTGSEALNKEFMDRIPMRRPGQPDEMAKVALFLASDDASYVTGATLIADGGWATTGYPDLGKFFA